MLTLTTFQRLTRHYPYGSRRNPAMASPGVPVAKFQTNIGRNRSNRVEFKLEITGNADLILLGEWPPECFDFN